MDILKKYYTDAYSLIRKVDVKGWVVFDTPYGPYPAADPMNWWQFMTEKEYLRTMNDYHYYQLYTSAQVPRRNRVPGVATARCTALQRPVVLRCNGPLYCVATRFKPIRRLPFPPAGTISAHVRACRHVSRPQMRRTVSRSCMCCAVDR